VNRRLLFAVALLATFLASFLLGGVLRQAHTPPSPPQPHPTVTTTPSADPLAWYRSLPDARTMPACPTGIDPDRYFYRNCPTVPASKRSHP
jgi:hypothetical protein